MYWTMRHFKKLAVICTATMAISGCSTMLQDAIAAGMIDFVTTTVSGALASLIPSGDVISQLIGTVFAGAAE